jgi:hypothetical protein
LLLIIDDLELKQTIGSQEKHSQKFLRLSYDTF